MALIKAKTLPNGVTGDYWRLVFKGADYRGDTLIALWMLRLYKSKAVAKAGGEPLECCKVFESPISADVKSGNLYALGYEIVANTNDPELEGAVADE